MIIFVLYCFAQVGQEDFDAAVLRAVAGIEKKRSILVGDPWLCVYGKSNGKTMVKKGSIYCSKKRSILWVPRCFAYMVK